MSDPATTRIGGMASSCAMEIEIGDDDAPVVLPMAGMSEADADMVRHEIERQERVSGEFRVGGYDWDD